MGERRLGEADLGAEHSYPLLGVRLDTFYFLHVSRNKFQKSKYPLKILSSHPPWLLSHVVSG